MTDMIVLTIKPRWAKDIYENGKRFEFRKVIPRNQFTRILLYESSPVRRITGMAIRKWTFKDTPNGLWNFSQTWETSLSRDGYSALVPAKGSITKTEFMEYFKNSKVAHAIYIGRVIKYERQFDPVKIGWWKMPPQNFMYVPYEMRHKMELEGFPIDFTLRSID